MIRGATEFSQVRLRLVSVLALLLLVMALGANGAVVWPAEGPPPDPRPDPGAVAAWGRNSEGQVGNGKTADTGYPESVSFAAATEPPKPSAVRSISAGIGANATRTHNVAIDSKGTPQLSDDTVWAWGNNEFGQLGIDPATRDPASCPVPDPSARRCKPIEVQHASLNGVQSVSAGGRHSLAIVGGKVWAWGGNLCGQLGKTGGVIGPGGPIPQEVDGLNDIVAIAAGGTHSLALDSQGTVWAWGNNSSGQLGNGLVFDPALCDPGAGADPGPLTGPVVGQPTPSRVQIPFEATQVAAGVAHSLAVAEDGSVWAWGSNSKGELGRPPAVRTEPEFDPHSGLPRPVVGLPGGARAVSAGRVHSMALVDEVLSDGTVNIGTVWTWGGNSAGQRGDGTAPVHANRYPSPAKVVRAEPPYAPLVNVVAIDAGGSHNMALSAHQVWGWGSNGFGQLGQKTTVTSTDKSIRAVEVKIARPVAAVAAGEFHSAVLFGPTPSTGDTAPNPNPPEDILQELTSRIPKPPNPNEVVDPLLSRVNDEVVDPLLSQVNDALSDAPTVEHPAIPDAPDPYAVTEPVRPPGSRDATGRLFVTGRFPDVASVDRPVECTSEGATSPPSVSIGQPSGGDDEDDDGTSSPAGTYNYADCVGGNRRGARNFLRALVAYITSSKSSPALLYIPTAPSAPHGPRGMVQAGFSKGCSSSVRSPLGCFDVALNYSPRTYVHSNGHRNFPPGSGRYEHVNPDFYNPKGEELQTVDFSRYDAVIVGWTWPTEAEALGSRKAALRDYVNSGGGLAAFGQNPRCREGRECRTYDFLPFFDSLDSRATIYQANNLVPEFRNSFGNAVTPEGKSMGISDEDVNGWGFQQFFFESCAMDVIDVDARKRIVSLATPEPSSISCSGVKAPDVSVTEGNSGSAPAVFQVGLSSVKSDFYTLDYRVEGDTATAGTDFVPVQGTLLFAPGENKKTITVPVLGDTIPEPDETFLVKLSNSSGDFQGVAAGHIIDDDRLPPRKGEEQANEGSAGGRTSDDQFRPIPADSKSAALAPAPAPGLAPAFAPALAAAPAQANSQAQASSSSPMHSTVAQAGTMQVPQTAMMMEKEREAQFEKAEIDPGGSARGELLASARGTNPLPALALGWMAAATALALGLGSRRRNSVPEGAELDQGPATEDIPELHLRRLHGQL